MNRPTVNRPRRGRFIRHAAVVVILVGTLLYVALHDHDNDHDQAVNPPKLLPRVTGMPATGVQAAPPVDTRDLAWRDFYGIKLPSSPVDGPRDTRADLASGFTQTPRGALLAAINIAYRANILGGPKVYEPTITHQMIGEDAHALLSGLRYFQDRLRESESSLKPGWPVSIQAFRWQGYTPLIATLDLVTGGPGQDGTIERAVTRLQVQWVASDWRLVAPPGGMWGSAEAPLQTLDGYTRLTAGR